MNILKSITEYDNFDKSNTGMMRTKNTVNTNGCNTNDVKRYEEDDINNLIDDFK